MFQFELDHFTIEVMGYSLVFVNTCPNDLQIQYGTKEEKMGEFKLGQKLVQMAYAESDLILFYNHLIEGKLCGGHLIMVNLSQGVAAIIEKEE